jgi:hypothetical protein
VEAGTSVVDKVPGEEASRVTKQARALPSLKDDAKN